MVVLGLAAAVLVVYAQVLNHQFLAFDDNLYVTDNPHVRDGFSCDNVRWAFSFADKERTYWHPLTWLAHMLDCQLFGVDPGLHHLSNVALHLLTVVILFVFLSRTTGIRLPSALVATVMAVHPVNVESVAWVAERKTLLSAVLWMLTLLLWAWYARRPSPARYLATLAACAAGLLTKPVLVTIPCVLLLLDLWPLARLRLPRLPELDPESKAVDCPRVSLARAIAEKLPFLILALLSVVVSSASLRAGGEVIPTAAAPFSLRLANAVVSYLEYMRMMVVPEGLTLFYPYPRAVPAWQWVFATAVLLATTALTLVQLRRRPYLAVGWLWYLGTLVPMLGLVQAGLWPARADRWLYLPQVGLLIAVVWGGAELVRRLRLRRAVVATLLAATLATLTTAASLQVSHWRASLPLFEHAAVVTPDSYLAHTNLAAMLAREGRYAEATRHSAEALRIEPHAVAETNMGTALLNERRFEEAERHFAEAVRLDPGLAEAHNGLGVAHAMSGRMEPAAHHFEQALALKPDYEEARANLRRALARLEKADDAATTAD